MDFNAIIFQTNFLTSFGSSLSIAIFTAICSTLLGLIQAVLLVKTNTFGRFFLGSFILLPFLVPPYIHTISWVWLLSQGIGPAGSVDILSVTAGFARDILYSPGGVVFILTIYCTPLVTMILVSGLRSVSVSGEDAALMCSPPLSVIYQYSLRSLKPFVAGSLLLTMVISMLNFSVPDILRVHVLPIEIFIQLSVFYDKIGALFMSLPLVLMALGVMYMLYRTMESRHFFVAQQPGREPKVLLADSILLSLVGFVVLLTLASVSLVPPLVYLIKNLYSNPQSTIIIYESLPEIIYTFTLSALATLAALIVALPVAYHLSRNKRAAGIINILFMMPLAIPGALLALGMLVIGGWPVFIWFSSTSIFCGVGLSIHFLPFGVKLLESEFSRVKIRAEEVAKTITGSKITRFRYIVLPQILPGIGISFLFMFILMFSDLSIPLLLVPPGRETIPVKIYNLMHYGADEMVSVLCFFTVLVIITMSLLIKLWYRKCQDQLLNSDK